MPIKLNSAEYRTISIGVLVSTISLAIGIKYFSRAFPEAAIEFRVNRDDSKPLAEKFLAARGFRIEGNRHAAIFDFDDLAKVYLERTQGLVRMNGLTRGPIRLWRWSHRWFKPQQKEEFRVDVSPAGEVVGFDHEVPESAAGANLEPTAARAIAEKFLGEVMKRDLADLEFLEAVSEKRPARTDHSFTWKQKSVALGEGSLRVEVEVDGDQVAGYREFVKIPEQWTRDYEKLRSRNDAAQVVDQVFWFLLIAAGAIILILRLRDRDVPVRLAAAFGLVGAVLYFLGQLNMHSVEEFGYRTTDSYSSFVAGYLGTDLLAALGVGAAIFFLVASAEPVYRENYPGLVALRRYLSWQGLRTRSFFMANVVGIALTFFFFAYQTVFYLAAEKFGAWAPADVPFSDLLNTHFPWVMVLFIGFLPAVSEEMQFRAFAIPFLKKYLRSGPLALVLAAFIWGFLHSTYPNQPFYIRGVEVGLGGVVIGLIMLRFGILATLIWHYSVDAIYTAFLLVRSPNRYLMLSGAIAAGIMLVPLIVVLIAYLRSGTFTDESTLTNASQGISRIPKKEQVAAVESPLSYQRLSQTRVAVALGLAVVFIALAFVPIYQFGQGIKLHTTRQEAIRAADAFLSERQVNATHYHRVAWVHENVDSHAVRYLLEHRSIRESDAIYRQATRLVIWEARYFRPLEEEEYRVYVDPTDGRVFGFRHLVDEDAPGVSLSPSAAQELAEKFVSEHGYALSGFDLQNSEAKKRRARQDYTLVWQAKAADPRNVGEAHYRLEVEIAGDQIVGFSRFFKIPEQWERDHYATRLTNVILRATAFLLLLALVAGGLFLLVRQVRRGQVLWRPSAKVGIAIAMLMFLSELNHLPALEQQYPTSIPLATFHLYVGVSVVVVPLLTGLLGWLLAGLALSFYPEAWSIFRASARRVWRRDAIIATVLSVAATVAMTRFAALLEGRWHTVAPIDLDLVPKGVNSAWPSLAFFTRSLLTTLLGVAILGIVIYIVRSAWSSRAWWVWPAALVLLVALGPGGARSYGAYAVGWVEHFVLLAGTIVLIYYYLRDNLLAYASVAFATDVREPLISMFSQPAAFFRWNGLVLIVLVVLVFAWMFLTVEDLHPLQQSSQGGGE